MSTFTTPSKSRIWIATVLLLALAAVIAIRLTHNSAHADTDSPQSGQWYISGMHPWIIRPEPGNCPVCGMELTPLRPDMLSSSLSIDPQTTRSIGIRTQQAGYGALQDSVDLLASLQADETLRTTIVARSSGYVEDLPILAPYSRVQAGERIAAVSSPQLTAAAEELLTINVHSAAPQLRAASIRKLQVQGVAIETIEQILQQGEVPALFPITSPIDGVVLRRFVERGEWVQAGQPLAEIADFTNLQAVATVYPRQLQQLHSITEASFIPIGDSHHPVPLQLESIDPLSSPADNSTAVRFSAFNPQLTLRPGMKGTVRYTTASVSEYVLIPREAMLDSGRRQVAFVSLGDGRFEPRDLAVHAISRDGMVAVESGISPGEHVVVNGAFLLDGEARLRESLLKMVHGDLAADQPVVVSSSAAVTSEQQLQLTTSSVSTLEDLLRAYLQLTSGLAADDNQHSHHLFAAIQQALRQLSASEEVAASAGAHLQAMLIASSPLSVGADIHATRLALRPLSDALLQLIRLTGVPPSIQPLHQLRCPMFPEMGDDAYWLQGDATAANPYMGAAMLTCYDQREALQ